MSAEIDLLFLEKRVEAARLGASLTEPVATGSVEGSAEQLSASYDRLATALHDAYNDLKSLHDSIDGDKDLDVADARHLKQRVSTCVGEVARASQDFAAQIRFFEAMNPNDAATVKPQLDKFDNVDKATREFTVSDVPEDGAEITPEAEPEPDIDPMLM